MSYSQIVFGHIFSHFSFSSSHSQISFWATFLISPRQVLPSIASALQEYYRTVTLFASKDTICLMILSALQEYYRTVALFSKDDFPQKMLKGRLPSKNSQSMISLKKCSKDDFPQKMLTSKNAQRMTSIRGWVPSWCHCREVRGPKLIPTGQVLRTDIEVHLINRDREILNHYTFSFSW